MRAIESDLGAWTSDELVTEIMKRGATDRPSLLHLQTAVIRALLAESDSKLAAGSH